MAWIPIAAWIVAALIAIVVLGYCGYEIIWKSKRLRGDIAELNRANAQLAGLGAQLTTLQRDAQRRLAPSRPG